MNIKLSKKTEQLIVSGLVILVIFLVIINAAIFTARFDFTEDNTYKISKATKETLRGLDQPARVSFYISDKVVQQVPFAQMAIDLMKEIAASSRGRVSLEIVDPDKKGVSENDKRDLKQWELQSSDGKTSASVNLVYSGIVIRYKSNKEVIPVVSGYNYSQLEYEVVSRIRKMAYDFELKIGLLNLSGRPVFAPQTQEDIYRISYNALFEQSSQLYQDFSFTPLEVQKPIDSSFSAVVVVGSVDLDEQQLLILDQYTMRGGAVLYFIERYPLQFDIENQYQPITIKDLGDSPILEYFKSYGIEFESGFLMDKHAKQTMARTGGGIAIVPVVFQPSIKKANKNYPFHTTFDGITLYWPNALKIAPLAKEKESAETNTEKENSAEIIYRPAGVDVEVLLESSKDSCLALNPNPRVLLDVAGGVNLYQTVASDKKALNRYPVSVFVKGELKSFFAGKPIPQKTGEDALFETIVSSTDSGRFILIADTESISDYVFIDGQNELIRNLLYIRDIAEYLGGDPELLKVRTKIPAARLLDKKNAQKASLISMISQIVNLGLIPFVIILFAIIWLIVRNQRAGGNSKKSSQQKEEGTVTIFESEENKNEKN